MNNKHTPGPWIHQRDRKGERWEVLHPASGLALFQHTFDGEEAEANIKLSAAAPDLLDALKDAKKMYEKVQPAGGYQGVYENICAAIKKATQ